jgi:hypothetical protein
MLRSQGENKGINDINPAKSDVINSKFIPKEFNISHVNKM